MIDEAMFGVCTLRVEVQPEHLLITITTSRALDASAQRMLVSRPIAVASTRAALELTEDFLHSLGVWQEGANRSHRDGR
ncbi:hypothetical protein SAMN04487914_13911 [Arthrobacter sp. ok909]|uniref:hypothetical protein n=1 Tax=Arthrobacter sp. ok909 TaxID=1761746 RepID=UPI0008925600|nr:hypothetical protein [Arthrobacter sp. ok909]SDP78231.1 hypothetical protein SAMN04487914_13911 [Arthrobacter sp. ok909]